jgi:acetyltransferase
MTIPRAKRPLTDRIFRPRTIAIAGADTQDGRCLMANLAAGGFGGEVQIMAPGGPTLRGPPDLAVVASPPARIGEDLAALAAAGCGAAIVTGHLADPGGPAGRSGLRVLGPSSFGLAVPSIGLNATLSHIPPPQGHIALVTQSASLARAVVDWAGPNGVGFSHVVGLGGNTDIGFGLTLDWLSRDPDTRLILLDIRRVRQRRAFISAARAASRLRPVVALRPGGRLLDPSGQSQAVFEAALTRAGVFTVRRLESFLAAAETLSRAKPLRGEAMAVVTNAIGPGRLAADAALEAGIELAVLPPEAQASLTAMLPADLLHGLIYAGSAAPTDVASIAAMVAAVPQVGGVLVLLAPTGPGDAAAVESVIAAAHTAKLPLLTCVMGETTGAGLRRRLAEAGLPAFSTPEQAVQAFVHLLRDRRARAAARELPPSRVLDVTPDQAAVIPILQAASAAGRLALTQADSLAILRAYGMATGTEDAAAALQTVALRVADDPTFGPAIAIGSSDAPAAWELPPLNLRLAQDLARRAGLQGAGSIDQAADAAVRVSQLLVEHPEIAALRIDGLQLTPAGARALDAEIRLRPAGELADFAISPYPEQLTESWSACGEDFIVRPIRPEDTAAHAALISRIPPDDLRYRFFSALRQVAPEQMVRLTQIDYDREMAFIAVRRRDSATVGVARLVREADGARGEFAILVQPDSKGIGLARHLMTSLIAWARGRGMSTISGQVLADNHAMLGFVRRLGFAVRHLPDQPEMVEAVLDLTRHDGPV